MDITSTAQVSATPDTGASTQTQKSSKGDSSFKDEMSKVSSKEDTKAEAKTDTKTEAKAESKTEEQETQNSATEQKEVTVKADNKADAVSKQAEIQSELSAATVLSGSIDMTKMQGLNPAFSPETQALIDANMQLSELVSDTKVPTKVDYTTVQMDMNDTKFFTDLVQNTDKTMQNVVTELTQGTETGFQEVQKNVKVSATLMNALSEAVKNKQSFRIDFDKDISVVIRVDKDGALSARFIPGDAAVEQYLKQNMSSLRQRFDEQELPYKELSYSGQQKRERRENENNKEKNHE